MKLKLILPLSLAYFLLPTHVFSSEAVRDLLDVLKDKGALSQSEYKSLTRSLNAEERESVEQPQLSIQTDGGFGISTYDGEYAFKIGGRLMIDAARYLNSETDMGDGTEIRRARLDLEGVFKGQWGYEFGVDFADTTADIKDAYLSYQENITQFYQFGQFKEPFSLEELTSSRDITFMERALPNAFAPGRSLGVATKHLWPNFSLAAGVFGESFDEDVANEGDEGWSASSRATYAPWYNERQALHLGASYSHRQINSNAEIKYNARPESHITGVKFLNTGDIKKVDSVRLLGAEAAYVQGPFSLQGEYIRSDVKRQDKESLIFKGWYVLGSWFLTGESRHYKFKKGAFGRVTPHSKSGAWEIAARYSQMNLDDLEITGGEANQKTLGINWYVNDHIRVAANYIQVANNLNANDDGDATAEDSPEMIQIRLQADF